LVELKCSLPHKSNGFKRSNWYSSWTFKMSRKFWWFSFVLVQDTLR
jgi:hypothetical protein